MFKNTNSKKMTGILLALVLVTSLFIGGSIARYVTSTSSEDEARVAVWGINEAGTTMDLFKNEYKLEDDTLVAKSNDGDNIIAPGLNGASQFKIVEANANLKPEVMYEIKISLDDSEIADEIKNHPGIQWKVDNGEWGTWDEFKEELLMLSGDASGVKTYAPGTVAPEFANGKRHTVAWQWVMDSGNDVEDTRLGNLSADGQDITAKLVITVTAQQTDIDSTGMLEGNGSVYNINNPTPLVFRSAAPLNELQSVKIGDTTLTKNTDYTATSGSTVITLRDTYLADLEVGNYTISIISQNMTAKAKFKVIEDLELQDTPIVHNGIIPEGGVYYSGVTLIDDSYYDWNYEEYATKYIAGDTFPEIKDGDIYFYGDYEYRYNATYSDGDSWYPKNQNGWGVSVRYELKTTKVEFGELLTTINNKDLVSLDFAFGYNYMQDNPSIAVAPKIPNTVKSMYGTFLGCQNLTTAPIIPSSVTNMDACFEGCMNLTGVIEINSTPIQYDYALKDTQITEVIGSCSDEVKLTILATKNQEY